MSVKIYYAGESNSPLKSKTKKPVKYEDIRKSHKKSAGFPLYEDPDFPANNASLGKIGGDTAAQSGAAAEEGSYKWLRPHDICKSSKIPKPQFAAQQDGTDRFCSSHDLRQGGLGDCWYLAALSALTTRPDQLNFVIPKDNFNGFDDEEYCGAFHFR